MGGEKTEGSAEEGAKVKRWQIDIDGGDTWLFEESARVERYGGEGGMVGWCEGGGIERDL